MPQTRKRRVTTCVPCHTRKQKCNRQYPCNHCTRRRRPEECIYKPAPVDRPLRAILGDESRNQVSDSVHPIKHPAGVSKTIQSPIIPYEDGPCNQHAALTKSFGYFEDSSSNTMALLKNWDLHNGDDEDIDNRASPDMLQKIRSDLERMPRRGILDFLTQYFVSELNWMKQLVHAPSFLIHYQQWWANNRELTVRNVEYAVLILRICSYATQFLPSPTYPDDKISDLPLGHIRNTCVELGNSLSETCLALDWKGGLVRVQHILFAALNSSCEGRTDMFWEGIASASRAAQKAGVHTAAAELGGGQEFDKEMQRRIFCNLYLLDSHLSRQLDRVPFLPDNLVAEMLPRLRLVPETGMLDMDSDITAPELFTERLMQVQLGRFWRKYPKKQTIPYDPTQAEQRYEQFCSEYLPTLHPALTLSPDKKWDTQLPKLSMQRQLLHITIFDFIAWNFRPLLLLNESQITQLPAYKQVLLQSQKQKLAQAAVEELTAVSNLHSMFGGGHTRFAAIIFNSFEASVLLLTLLSRPDFPFDQTEENHDILGRQVTKLTRNKAMQAVEKALNRLQILSGVSDMAAAGARVVSQLFAQASRLSESAPPAIIPGLSNTSELFPGSFSDLLRLGAVVGHDEDWGFEESLYPNYVNGLFSAGVPGDEYRC